MAKLKEAIKIQEVILQSQTKQNEFYMYKSVLKWYCVFPITLKITVHTYCLISPPLASFLTSAQNIHNFPKEEATSWNILSVGLTIQQHNWRRWVFCVPIVRTLKLRFRFGMRFFFFRVKYWAGFFLSPINLFLTLAL